MSFKKAREILFQHIGECYIKDFFYTPDFYEFTVRLGGDIKVWRVYKTGVITER